MKPISKEKVLKDYNSLKQIAYKYLNANNYEKALRTVFVACGFMYTYSQIYYDNELEDMMECIAQKVGVQPDIAYKDEKSILFYDGFGNDRRGLAVIYLQALRQLGYNIIYVTYESYQATIGQIKNIVESSNIYYIKNANMVEQIAELNKLINKTNVSKAMLYMCPDDVVGVAVFSQYKGVIERFLINLTDHAFWLGKSVLDFIIEFRHYGALLSYQERKISKEKIFCLPFYPNIVECEFRGLPFELAGKKMIFSGGALYKTYGMNNLYYIMVEEIIKMDDSILFYYVGEGDSTEINKLIKKYPERVYYGKERTDFYEVIKRCYFYLSTYPYFGGLMTQYAIAAGKLPITLASEEIIGGQTVETDDAWYFQDVNVLYEEIRKLITDTEYLKGQEERVGNSIVTQKQFEKNLGEILAHKMYDSIIKWENIDVQKTKDVVLGRIKHSEYYGFFCRVKAPFLILKFPIRFLTGLVVNMYKQKILKGKGI